MVTAKELIQGLKGIWEYDVDGLIFKVHALDAKRAYGHDRVLIKPVAGRGERWVDETSVRRKE